MSVEQIEEAIRQLSPQDLAAIRAWFAEYDWEAWDRQIEADSAAGRLDGLVAEVLEDRRLGRCTKR